MLQVVEGVLGLRRGRMRALKRVLRIRIAINIEITKTNATPRVN
jgi:hypothetical protein